MELSCLTLDFEGKPLTTLTVNGRPAWLAREIGVGLGYAHRGDRFVSKLSGEWSGEFVDGLDVARLTGPELARQLFVSLNTLRTHTKRIFTKLDVNNRAAAVRRARELGLL